MKGYCVSVNGGRESGTLGLLKLLKWVSRFWSLTKLLSNLVGLKVHKLGQVVLHSADFKISSILKSVLFYRANFFSFRFKTFQKICNQSTVLNTLSKSILPLMRISEYTTNYLTIQALYPACSQRMLTRSLYNHNGMIDNDCITQYY